MDRRRFVKLMGGMVAGGTALHALTSTVAASGNETIEYSGSDLQGWQTVLGDALYAAPGQASVNANDIATQNQGNQSTLWANVQERGVMAHNITYTSVTNNQAFDYVHVTGYRFRLPYIPLTWNSPHNAQTFEGGCFIWDGSGTRLDYGHAFQWVLNPWMSSFGTIYTWTSNATSQWWAPSGYLQPDTNWHTIAMTFDYHNKATSLLIDNIPFGSVFTATPKPSNWGTGIAARFQVEIISLWPGNSQQAPSHLVEVADWHWTWLPN